MITDDILETIKKSNKFAITFHKSPDGDSIGSALALFQGLKSIGKQITLLSMEKVPEDFKFLPYSDIIDPDKFEVESDVDCVIVLDCGDKKRINANLDFDSKSYTIVNIDHHLTNEQYGDLNYVDTKAAAVSEIMYDILKKIDINIDKDMAICMYTSLITDTGSFRYSSTTEKTHNIAGNLINTGFDFSKIHRMLFENKKFEKVKLSGKAIESMKIIDESICVIYVTKAMIDEVVKDGMDIDTHDIVNIGLQIGKVEVALLLKESEEGIKASLRSKEIVDVRKIAEKFNGGGHMRAAGLEIHGKDINEAGNLIIKEIQKELM
ncbi:bifunctional oligoribonuclease/PAP phosphatase NrnA [Clostridium tyrobutyricum]|jgi:phosphoesterase RecJ-like protein|uniref:FIG146085: 3'-to-5' oligoribonuclease A, Bacillus type n=1 Tax=Clostridium tyrobutyricum DIVETGP TaxID=1408889 RepID=W6N4V9_CLOTY|nr:bifunctional oligoribonuclease/PAP phosphatase NrnA [Clostridium tyrobutyricum]AND85032.1 exopolyphosphatase family protein [Clostridium tyrobutyricum]ANP69594.1 1-pyrroline-5-carboxylate dehydrogenase [Clostridium tyrobutyricum]MBR9647065.1 bifunctional oligoribonuclease/PAP phosphatase NrnA [Clostridium tyrobutyricum]MBV4414859.1 bifunctional oligoribonuclease/PAP phosphatase NrnA [Clostridium tyrobutyricum]MBV4420720.1 bifunctional oligoribonuclease/PAP phosphatase NrnA [Clostridium tyro